MDDWFGGLFTSGGALKAIKIFWYPIFWIWHHRVPSYGKVSPCKKDIFINNGVIAPCKVPKLDCSVAKEILGVWQVPDGSQAAQLEKLSNMISDYIDLLHKNFLSRKIPGLVFGMHCGHL